MPFLKTQTIVTEFIEIEPTSGGMTIGQQIDMMIEDALGAEGHKTRLHNVEFGFETDQDWHMYRDKVWNLRHGDPVGKVNLKKKRDPSADWAVPVGD